MYWAIPLFGAAAVFFAFKLDTDRGVIINGIIHLGVTGAPTSGIAQYIVVLGRSGKRWGCTGEE